MNVLDTCIEAVLKYGPVVLFWWFVLAWVLAGLYALYFMTRKR
jgi:hypothetical protein